MFKLCKLVAENRSGGIEKYYLPSVKIARGQLDIIPKANAIFFSILLCAKDVSSLQVRNIHGRKDIFCI
jgi:hypothetical protein